MPAIVEISNLDFAYRDQLVLKQLNLQIEQCSTLGLIGPNGAGKTTLIQLLLGLLKPTRGQIAIAGLSPRDAIRRGDIIGYVPQRPGAPENFPISVRQLAVLGLAGKTGMLRSYESADLEFVDQLLHRLGINELADQPVGSISGGQYQRALIARALAPKPKLLLLDEPTTGIDRAGQQRFMDSIADLKKWMEMTVVIVTHDLRFVSAMCDRIACLNVTLHYHDVPNRVPADLIYGMFACDLQALGIDETHKSQDATHKQAAKTETGKPR